MQVVIEIPKEAYNRLLEEKDLPNRIDLEYYIVHGMVLPEGHGRLIDASETIESLRDFLRNRKTIGQCVDDTPTIIKADIRSTE